MICPRCKGRRVVFNPMSLFLTIGLPMALFMDAGCDEGITKRRCPVCLGTGWLAGPEQGAALDAKILALHEDVREALEDQKSQTAELEQRILHLTRLKAQLDAEDGKP